MNDAPIKQAAAPIWVLDDSASFLSVTLTILEDAGFKVRGFNSPADLLDKLNSELPHVIVSDIVMPDMNGVELLNKIKGVDQELPVILVTSSPNLDFATRAVRDNAFEFLIKPIPVQQLIMSVGRAVKYMDMAIEKRRSVQMLDVLVRMRTRQLTDTLSELNRSRFEIIHALTLATEYRDNDTAEHIRRIGLYSRHIAQALWMDEKFCEEIFYSSPMHDIGKIGIPDSLLLKAGTFTPAEYKLMQTHTTLGANMLSGSESSMMAMAREIALCHHERWNGTGYPMGLKGKSIPLPARIVMMADQYDALRCRRPYKEPFSHRKAYEILWSGDDRTSPDHFDPEILRVFMDTKDKFEEIYEDNIAEADAKQTPSAYRAGQKFTEAWNNDGIPGKS